MILEIIIGIVVLVISIILLFNICEFIGWLGMKIFKKYNKVDGFIDLLLVTGLGVVVCVGCHYLGKEILEILKWKIKNKKRPLSYYRLNKYNEVNYTKRFILGVSKKEIEEMFRKHLLEGFLTQLIGVRLLESMTKDELDRIMFSTTTKKILSERFR